MKHSSMLMITSLLSILFGTFHLADDIARGMSPGGLPNLFAVVICVVWLYGTLVLAERRSRYVIILIASLLLMGGGELIAGSPTVASETVWRCACFTPKASRISPRENPEETPGQPG